MQDTQNTQDMADINAALTQEEKISDEKNTEDRPKLKRNNLKEDFKKKGDEVDKENKPPMSREETLKFYESNLPFMRLQDEFEEIRYRFEERRIKNLEMQVREVQAIGYLSEWKAGQDEAQKRQEQEQKMKAEWDAMTDEQKEEWKLKAKANLRIMEMQAKGTIMYDGNNTADILSFVTGEVHESAITSPLDGTFTFSIPVGENENVTLKMLPGQTLSRTEAGQFIVS